MEYMRNIVPLNSSNYKKSVTEVETKNEPVKNNGSRFSLF
jgi:hypothetical protein